MTIGIVGIGLIFLAGMVVGISCLAFFAGRPTEVEYRRQYLSDRWRETHSTDPD
jgi:hypothetical protein